MKKNIKNIIIILLFIFSLYQTISKNNLQNILEEKSINVSKQNLKTYNNVAIMYETAEDSGEYQQVTGTSWPTSGYRFNPTLSKCENGSAISWDKVNKKVIVNSNVSDKCYVYFDVNTIVLALNNYTFSWNEYDGATSYKVYSDDEVLATTTNTSIELYEYYDEGGTYNISVVGTDGDTELKESNTIEYTIEQLNIDDYILISGCYFDVSNSCKEFYNNTNIKYTTSLPNNIEYIKYMNSTGYDKYHYGTSTYSQPNYNIKSYNCLTGIAVFYDYELKSNWGTDLCEEKVLLSDFVNSPFSNKFYFDSSTRELVGITYGGTGMRGVAAYQLIVPGMAPSKWVHAAYRIICVTSDTPVYVYDDKKKKYKKKKIRNIDYDDELLVWDFDKGRFTKAKPLWIKKIEKTDRYNYLKFSDGSELKTISQHRIFNLEKGMFTYPMSEDTPIGTTTFNSKGEYVKLVEKKIVYEEVEYCNIITDYHMNLFAGDILTSCRLSNLYEIKDMKYVKDNRKLKAKELFSDIDEKWIKGLRLLEQPEEINSINDKYVGDIREYINNLIELQK